MSVPGNENPAQQPDNGWQGQPQPEQQQPGQAQPGQPQPGQPSYPPQGQPGYQPGAPQMTPGGGQWLIRIPGQPESPVDLQTLMMLARSEILRPETQIVDANTGYAYQAKQIPGVFSDKDFTTTLILSLLIGGLGIDRFYLGYTGLGVLKLLTLGGCGVWSIIDVVLIAMRKLPDVDGRPLS